MPNQTWTTPAADSGGAKNEGDTNYGASVSCAVRYARGDFGVNIHEVYIRFDIMNTLNAVPLGDPNLITKAELTVHNVGPPADLSPFLEMQTLTGNGEGDAFPWTENVITFNNAPTTSGQHSFPSVGDKGNFIFDVLDLVKEIINGGHEHEFRLDAPADSISATIAMKEDGVEPAPSLYIEWNNPPPESTGIWLPRLYHHETLPKIQPPFPRGHRGHSMLRGVA